MRLQASDPQYADQIQVLKSEPLLVRCAMAVGPDVQWEMQRVRTTNEQYSMAKRQDQHAGQASKTGLASRQQGKQIRHPGFCVKATLAKSKWKPILVAVIEAGPCQEQACRSLVLFRAALLRACPVEGSSLQGFS